MSHALLAYRRARTNEQDPVRLLLMLLDEAVSRLERARLAQDPTERRGHVIRAVRIVTELVCSLDCEVGGEAALGMLKLYMFIQGCLGDAIQGDDSRIPDALRILRHVRETWREAARIAGRA